MILDLPGANHVDDSQVKVAGVEIPSAQKPSVATIKQNLKDILIVKDQTPTDPPEKAITKDDIETALSKGSYIEAGKYLLDKSPIGLTSQPKLEDIEKMGYHSLAIYCAPGHSHFVNGKNKIEVIEGKDENKIIYKNDDMEQIMTYDKEGNLKSCDINVKNKQTNEMSSLIKYVKNDEGGMTALPGDISLNSTQNINGNKDEIPIKDTNPPAAKVSIPQKQQINITPNEPCPVSESDLMLLNYNNGPIYTSNGTLTRDGNIWHLTDSTGKMLYYEVSGDKFNPDGTPYVNK